MYITVDIGLTKVISHPLRFFFLIKMIIFIWLLISIFLKVWFFTYFLVTFDQNDQTVINRNADFLQYNYLVLTKTLRVILHNFYELMVQLWLTAFLVRLLFLWMYVFLILMITCILTSLRVPILLRFCVLFLRLLRHIV